MSFSAHSLPSAALLEEQAQWLSPARSGLLRRAAIAQRRTVLDLGAGRGMVTGELSRRSDGLVYALDRSLEALHEIRHSNSLLRIVGNAEQLPFANQSLAMIFSQFTLLWVNNVTTALSEIWRVLEPGGEFCAIEPDFSGLIEFPLSVAIGDVWRAALDRCGATCDIGRRLPGVLETRGFKVQVRLLDQLVPPSPLRYAMLRELPLEPQESAVVAAAERAAESLDGWQQIAHLPLFLINARRPQ